jgi:hypothetical protein
MGGSFGGEGELLAGLEKNADAGLAALRDKTGDARVMAVIVALTGDEDVVKAAAAGLEGFLDRVQAVENFHGIQFTARDTKGAGF